MSRIFTDTAAARNIRLKRTRTFRPQTNGKAERSTRSCSRVGLPATVLLHRERLNALPWFLAYYNHRRPHGASAGYSRLAPVNNVPGNYT